MSNEGTRWVALGRIKGAVGLQGEVKVTPYALAITRLLPDPTPQVSFPLTTLLEHRLWRLGRESMSSQEVTLVEGQLKGDRILGRLQGIQNREEIQSLAGLQIWLPWSALPVLSANQFYWLQLIGLLVLDVTEPGMQPVEMGRVESLFSTGSNDVLNVRMASGEERLLPFIHDTIVQVDLDAAVVMVQLMPGL